MSRNSIARIARGTRFYDAIGPGTSARMLVLQLDPHNKIVYQWVIAHP